MIYLLLRKHRGLKRNGTLAIPVMVRKATTNRHPKKISALVQHHAKNVIYSKK
jgi:hypothetical protein